MANDIDIKIAVDGGSAVKVVNDVTTAMNNLRNAALKASGTIDSNEKGLSKLSSAAKSAGGSIKSARDSVKDLESALAASSNKQSQLASAMNTFASSAVQGFSRVQASVVTLNQGLELIQKTARLVSRAFDIIGEGAQRAFQFTNLETKFNDLSLSIGNLGSDKIERLRAATQGLVSDFDLFKAANNAVLLGVDDGSGKFEKLASAATKLGLAMGQDAAASIADLSRGIGRQSRLILDNLGIIIRAKDTYEQYAQSIGVSALALTAEQKQIAFTNAAIDQIEKKVSSLSDVVIGSAGQWKKLEASLQNASDRFLQGVSSSDKLTEALGNTGTGIDNVAQLAGSLGKAVGDAAGSILSFANDFVSGMNIIANKIAEVQNLVSNSFLFQLGKEGASALATSFLPTNFGSSINKFIGGDGFEPVEIELNVRDKASKELEKVKKILEEDKLEAESTASAFSSISKAVDSAANSFAVNSASDAGQFLDIVNQAIEQGRASGKGINAITEDLKILGSALANTPNEAKIFSAAVKEAFEGPKKASAEASKAVTAEVKELDKALASSAEALEDFLGKLDIQATPISQSLKEVFSTEGLATDTVALENKLNSLRLEFVKDAESAEDFKDALKEVQQEQLAAADAAQEISDAYAELDNVIRNVVDGPQSQLTDEMAQFIKLAKRGELSSEELADKIEEIGRAAKLSKEEIASLAQEVESGLRTDFGDGLFGQLLGDGGFLRGTDFGDELAVTLDGVFSTFGDTASIATTIESGLAQALTIAVNSAGQDVDTRQVAIDMASSLGGAIGGYFGPIGELIGAEIGKDLAEIGDNTRDTIEGIATIFGLFGGPIAGAAAVLGTGFVLDMFDFTPEARRFARKQVRDFFADLEEESGRDAAFFSASGAFEVNQEDFEPFLLQDIDETTGQVIGERLTSGIEEKLAQLDIPAELVSTFDGIALALSEVLGFDTENLEGFLGSFSQLLQLNLQNSFGLNELQILFQEAGLSAEQFGQALSDAFRRGDVSAKEFLNATNATEDLFTQGIPGAVGATDIAFTNLVNNGLATGADALDAFGDIGAEAIEGNITSFQQLEQSLVAAGASAEQVSQLFTVLSANGIDTIEKLANIDLKQSAQIVSGLQDIGFAFQENEDKVDSLTQKLENFQNVANQDIETKYKINVEVTGTDALDDLPPEGRQQIQRNLSVFQGQSIQ